MMRRWVAVALSVGFAWSLLDQAHARPTGTDPLVEELATELEESWGGHPSCRTLSVEEIVVSRNRLQVFTVDNPLLVQADIGERPGLCGAQGVTVYTGRGGSDEVSVCAEALCRWLDESPSRTGRLTQLLRESRDYPAPPPVQSARVASPEMLPGAHGWVLGVMTCALLGLLLLMSIKLCIGLSPFEACLALAFGLIAVTLRLTYAEGLALRPDELFSWGQDSLWIDLVGPEIFMNPPLYRVIAWPWMADSGADPAIGRLVAAALGGLASGLAFVVGRSWSGRSGGVLAGLLVTLHPHLVLAGVFHRSYAVVPWLVVLSLGGALRMRDEPENYRAWWLTVLLAACCYAHYLGIVFAVALWGVYGLQAAIGERRRLWWPLSVWGLMVAPLIPVVVSGGETKVSESLGLMGYEHAWSLALSLPAVLGGLVPPPLEAPVYEVFGPGLWLDASVGAAVLFIVMLGANGRRGRWWLLVWLTVAVTVAMSIRIAGVRDFQLIFASVAACLLATLSLRSAGRLKWLPWVWPIIMVIGLEGHWPEEVQEQHPGIAALCSDLEREAATALYPYGAALECAYFAGQDREQLDASSGAVLPLNRCSNSAVYGALRRAKGRVRVIWSTEGCDETILLDGRFECRRLKRLPDALTGYVCTAN